MNYRILLINEKLSPLAEHVLRFFDAKMISKSENISLEVQGGLYRSIVVDCTEVKGSLLSHVGEVLEVGREYDLPVVLLGAEWSLGEKLAAYEQGCDDIIDIDTDHNEISARINKGIFNRIASEQLSKRLEDAQQTAHAAMSDNSYLGENIRFLVAINECNNLDQLGQQFFSAIRFYGIKCSLQMRSTIGIKNMEAHGMSKDLESQLLYQFKDADCYVDFGCRTICNYDRVSVLIKNMPIDQPEKYGTIKDNTFYMLQGINARIHAIEDRHTLIEEKECLRKLSADVNNVMSAVKDRYRAVMQGIMAEVEASTTTLQSKIPEMALTEAEEQFVDGILASMIETTNVIFNEGLKIDEVFMKLEASVEQSLDALADHPELAGSLKNTKPIMPPDQNASVLN